MSVYTNRTHQAAPKHLPTISITPHGHPHRVLYNFVHTQLNAENYLLTPSKNGDLCVAKLSLGSDNRSVSCEASRNLKWFISNAGVMNPVYKVSLPNPSLDGDDLPLFQISKPNPNANFWSLFYFVFGGYQIPPKRIEFGKITKSTNKDKQNEFKIAITGKTSEEKAVWQTLGEGNEDAVEWVILCTILNLLDDEIKKSPSEIPIMQPQSKTSSLNRKPSQAPSAASTTSATSAASATSYMGAPGHYQQPGAPSVMTPPRPVVSPRPMVSARPVAPRPVAPVVAAAPPQNSRMVAQRTPQLAPIGFAPGGMPMPIPMQMPVSNHSKHPQHSHHSQHSHHPHHQNPPHPHPQQPHRMPQQAMPPRMPSRELYKSR
ncbi:hypothetical protein E3P89_00159 [Wallemia ichthyophaga]|uniref:Uncharacterized protein n=1 Tax=Wallemia ichthyophaga TaxID=245174 RepID=A0A4T0ICR9_WALIC|nr:hypothetical protein E3P90_00007 [Wallemia ichthyophaga]TIB18529.1 hypothetical protein E3P93_00007 [Wallemia ichthyophaga]TIB26320.1 hypothetical protein E3P89_00159 [Wallemia ichthyophaga]TIB27380.1 hypothetical protein E3P88_00007 [Wallemia ichthyophaga]